MRRFLATLFLICLGLYVALQLALGSSPVQRRVLSELQQELMKVGLDLQIESIEFSAFAPRIYLNRVTLRARPLSPVPLRAPLAIDKIKIEFQPFALIYGAIVIEELALFHPVVAHDSVDVLYQKVSELLTRGKKAQKERADFAVTVKKAGVVDALLNIRSLEPEFKLQTPSLTAFVATEVANQVSVMVEGRELAVEHGTLKTLIKRLDADVDIAKTSVRVNRLVTDSAPVTLNVKGVAGIPAKGEKGWPSSFNLSYDAKLDLPWLMKLPFWKGPELQGKLMSQGTLALSAGTVAGNGGLEYRDVAVDGYRIGGGKLSFSVDRKRALLKEVELSYAGGALLSESIQIEMGGRYPISGDLHMKDLRLESILESVKSPGAPLRLTESGSLKVSGFLASPLKIRGEVDGHFPSLTVLNRGEGPVTRDNTVLSTGSGKIRGVMTFFSDRMDFAARVGVLEGELDGSGTLSFDNFASLSVKGGGLSLTALGHIAELEMGGRADIEADIEVQGSDPKISGTFRVTDAAIGGIELGPVSGRANFRNGLLGFEGLSTPSLEPITGSGFVDFTPKRTHYRFEVEGKRAEMARVFGMFRRQKLGFQPPTGGDLTARLWLEGGHDDKGIELKATGTGRNFQWYGEKWQSARFAMSYRPSAIELNKVSLFKRSGGLEVRGQFLGTGSSLAFTSHGLLVEELDHLGQAPLAGELIGSVELELGPNGGVVGGKGEARLGKATFRSGPLPDVQFRILTADKGVGVLVSTGAERFTGRFSRNRNGTAELSLNFSDFDFAPFLAAGVRKDLPYLLEATTTGQLNFNGDFSSWRTLSGSGKLSSLKLGLRGSPLQSQGAIRLNLEKGHLVIDRFVLSGSDSQIALDLNYQPTGKIVGNLDGKLDLLFLQPFIPGLDYGTGKVTTSLRLSGPAEKFILIGNAALEDGTFRLSGLAEEFRSVQAQITVGHDKLGLDRFRAQVNSGTLRAEGEVRIDRLSAFAPELRLSADRVAIKTRDYLTTRFSGELVLRGASTPYQITGKCQIDEATLTKFDTADPPVADPTPPTLAFDVRCEARDKLYVKTDIMDAEMRGSFHLLGHSARVGLLGNAEVLRGTLLFRETKFNLGTGTVKFESPSRIAPRFSIAGRSLVKEERAAIPVEYEVYLQAIGTPEDYKIRLSSSPALAESEIISLLLLGITGRTQEGNYLDLGTAVVGQTPLQSKLQNELGFDIKIRSRSQTQPGQSPVSGVASSSAGTDLSVPSVTIQKEITRKTKLSYSSTLDASPIREYKIEQMLDEHFTVNASRVDNSRASTSSASSPTQTSYGLDVRYRFQFE